MKRCWLILLIAAPAFVFAQEKLTRQDYVELYGQMAVNEMHRSGVPASITLAQGILESGCGNSQLTRNANNHFGIKCHTGWEGKGYYMDDDAEDECFRVYESAEESFKDHSEFLTSRPRYKGLFDLKKTDYKGWAKGLKQAGYATNPKYADLLIKIIEEEGLHAYDKMEANEIPPGIAPSDIEPDRRPLFYYYSLDPTYDGSVFLLNNVKTVKAREGDNPLSLATAHHISLKNILKYNDMEDGEEFIPGQNVFIQPKRKKGDQKFHVVDMGQSMWDISQIHGIKLEKLYEKNLMDANTQPAVGETIYLKKEREIPVKTRTYDEVMEEKMSIMAQLATEHEESIVDEQDTNEDLVEETQVVEELHPVEEEVAMSEEEAQG